jgi:hypothetical protein
VTDDRHAPRKQLSSPDGVRQGEAKENYGPEGEQESYERLRGARESSTLKAAWLESPEVLREIALLRVAQPKFAHAMRPMARIQTRSEPLWRRGRAVSSRRFPRSVTGRSGRSTGSRRHRFAMPPPSGSQRSFLPMAWDKGGRK